MLASRRNVGNVERVVRGVLAVGAVAGSAVFGVLTGWGIVLLVVAGIAALTGATGYCPIYRVLGVGTRGRRGDRNNREHGRFHLHRAA